MFRSLVWESMEVCFFVALLLINISTFETIIQGFELSYYQRSKDVDKVRQELNEIKNEIRIH